MTNSLATVLSTNDHEHFRAVVNFVFGLNDFEDVPAVDAEFWAWLLTQEADSEAIREVAHPRYFEPEDWTDWLASNEQVDREVFGYHS